MILPVILTDVALAEAASAFDYYERRQPGLGVRFTEAVQECLDRVSANPHLYATVHRDIREGDINGFSYRVYYIAEPTRVRVISVFHTSRNPNIWKRRR